MEKEITNIVRMINNKLSYFNSNDYYTIIGGVFNCPLKDLDKKRGGSPDLKISSINEIQTLTSFLYLQDVWRIRNPDKRQFTLWRQHKPLFNEG